MAQSDAGSTPGNFCQSSSGVGVLAVVAFFIFTKRKSQQLRSKFGPEYDHTVDEVGSRRKAEEVLKKREARVQQFNLRPLSEADRGLRSGAADRDQPD